MNVVELRALLEQEATWRDEELRLMRNALAGQGLGEEDATYCRTLLVMTYAHLEGFVKQALSVYVGMLNAESYTCGQLVEPLAASTLAVQMKLMRNPLVAVPQTVLDLELKLQRQAEREVDLVRKVREHDGHVAVLDADDLTATDSNLSPAVLRRNLYRLGLDPEVLATHHNGLAFLLRTRNDIAHGKRTETIPPAQFRAAVAAAQGVMNALPQVLYSACRWGKFFRPEVAL
jgi:hypothetical protein